MAGRDDSGRDLEQAVDALLLMGALNAPGLRDGAHADMLGTAYKERLDIVARAAVKAVRRKCGRSCGGALAGAGETFDGVMAIAVAHVALGDALLRRLAHATTRDPADLLREIVDDARSEAGES